MALPEKLLANYAKFQAKNGVPIFLKGGTPDKVLFGMTVAGCVTGFFSIVHMVYTMGFTKKN